MSDTLKLLFIGDIVGRPGRRIVQEYLCSNKSKYDFVIANVENASHGFGLTKKNHDELISYGINCMTSGNHIWDKKDIYSFIDDSDCLIRPYNYHKSAQGVGYRVFDKIVVINLLGRTFMPPIDCPFTALEGIIEELKEKNLFNNHIILIDFHAEATAEKQCFARFASELGVSAVLGTHTHVQTADETIINNKTAYITDAGYSGSKNSIIGMKYDTSLRRLITSINERFDIEDEKPYIMNACEIDFRNNIASGIRRISFVYSIDEDGESED
ncbi:YmdB family metallophosphoesterase [bacterium]|nr:YmdB family metallophosphoesterase [bacterium]